MSLISEALKEAQRERTERAGPRAAATIVDNIFPYPSKGGRRAPNRNFLIVAAVGVIVLAGVGFGLRWLAQRPSNPAITTPPRHVASPVTSPNVSANAPAKIAAKSENKPAAGLTNAITTNKTNKPVSAPPTRATQPDAAPAKRADVVSPRVAVADSSNAKPPAPVTPAPVTPAPAPIIKPQGSPTSSGVRIVLDPSGVRPSDSLFAQAFAEQKRGNVDMARELYEKALAKPPVAPELYNNYGALLASLKQHTAAIVMYNLGLKGNENDSRLWSNLADSYNATGRHAEAMGAYAQAAKLDPSNGIVKTRLAAEYAAIGDTSSARRMFDEAVRVAPKDAGVHYAYGAYLQSQRDLKGAIRELQLFVDLAPGAYDQANIDSIKKHITTLRQANP